MTRSTGNSTTRLLSVVGLFALCLTVARADDAATIRPVDSKTRPAPKKHTGLVVRAPQPVAGDLQSALRRQIWLAQHKIPAASKRVRPIPTSVPPPPVSRNAYRKSLRDRLQGINSPARTGIKPDLYPRRNTLQVTPIGTPASTIGKNSVLSEMPDSHVAGEQNSGEEKSGSPGVMLVLAALCVSLAGTAAILYLVSKRQRRAVTQEPAREEAGPRMMPPLRQPEASERIYSQRVDTVDEEICDTADDVVELAQRFHRGRGEMQLMFDLQAHKEDVAAPSSMMKSSAPSGPNASRRKKAMKIGASKGEAELLARLQKFHTSANHAQRML